MNPMASFLQTACRFCRGLSIVLLCVFGLVDERAEAGGGEQRLPKLGPREASHLLLSHVTAAYPAVAKVNYIHGRVRVRLKVDTEGKVVKLHVVSGNPLLAAAALDSVAACRFRPYVARNGSGPIAFETTREVSFSIRTNSTELVPRKAESYFRRQVKPPEVLSGPGTSAAADSTIRLRLLISAEG